MNRANMSEHLLAIELVKKELQMANQVGNADWIADVSERLATLILTCSFEDIAYLIDEYARSEKEIKDDSDSNQGVRSTSKASA